MEEFNCKVCDRCGARWINNQHYWSGTGKEGNETELASLVCDKVNDPQCINPAKGTTDGKGWQKRLGIIDELMKKIDE